ncbi:MAG TPA: hypothetical protein VFC26_05005, partial [Verrucomicrobiae bacterium]|nr:hypothetical protein [Verrucomicrobiae bacterium]
MRSGQMADLMDDLRKEKGRIVLREHLSLFLKVFIAGFLLAAAFATPLAIWVQGVRIETLKEQVMTANAR